MRMRNRAAAVACYERAGYRCERCGRPSKLEAHHRLPVAQGGTDNPDNLECLCVKCHLAHHARHLSEGAKAWRKLLLEAIQG